MTVIIPIVSALVTGILSLIGVMLTNSSSNRKVENQLMTSQAVTDTKIENLTSEVRRHNDFASKIPAIEEKVNNIDRRVEFLEQKELDRG